MERKLFILGVVISLFGWLNKNYEGNMDKVLFVKMITHSVISGTLLISTYNLLGVYYPDLHHTQQIALSLPVVLVSDTVLVVLTKVIQK